MSIHAHNPLEQMWVPELAPSEELHAWAMAEPYLKWSGITYRYARQTGAVMTSTKSWLPLRRAISSIPSVMSLSN
jgi:uncharacterized protein YeaO (DUF488 family)